MGMLRWSPAQLSEYRGKQKAPAAAPAPKSASLNQTGSQRFRALGRLPKGKMNKTEEAYSERLEAQRIAGEIIGWKFHPMRVRLADNTYYEVDFLVMHADMSLAIHETKGGFTTDKGQLKIKLCAEVLPWFRVLKATKQPKKDGGGWSIEEF